VSTCRSSPAARHDWLAARLEGVCHASREEGKDDGAARAPTAPVAPLLEAVRALRAGGHERWRASCQRANFIEAADGPAKVVVLALALEGRGGDAHPHCLAGGCAPIIGLLQRGAAGSDRIVPSERGRWATRDASSCL
jgi:hypothetical protein